MCVARVSLVLQENVSPAVIAAMYEDEFKRDMLSLKVCAEVITNVFFSFKYEI